MATIRNRLYPVRDYTDHDVINWYSLDASSGAAGTLVKVSPTAADPSNQAGYSSNPLGAATPLSVSLRFETKSKVTATASGDTRNAALGITLLDVTETDENGLPLRYYPQRAKEILAVVSGQTVPVATRGTFGIWGNYIDQALAVPTPGYVAVVSNSGNGLLAVADPTNTGHIGQAGSKYQTNQIVGKWISTTGSQFAAQGGWAFVRLNVES